MVCTKSIRTWFSNFWDGWNKFALKSLSRQDLLECRRCGLRAGTRKPQSDKCAPAFGLRLSFWRFGLQQCLNYAVGLGLASKAAEGTAAVQDATRITMPSNLRQLLDCACPSGGFGL